jgi:AraC-like DNA-binding protein
MMLNENLDAGSAGGRVGYESASQFSREYSRLFGAPPQRDITRLRIAPVAGAALPKGRFSNVHRGSPGGRPRLNANRKNSGSRLGWGYD